MADINGKWLKDDSVNDDAIQLKNYNGAEEGWLRDAGGKIIAKDTGNSRIIFDAGFLPKSSVAPTNTDDLVNKNYVDSALFGLKDLKDPVRVATTVSDGNFVIAGNGAAAQTIDGQTLVNGDRVLLKNQTAPAENGIYTVSGIGVDAVYTRATDADNGTGPGSDVTHGMSCIVEEGNENALAIFALTTKDPITLDTTPLTFVETPNPADHFDPTRFEQTIPGGTTTDGTVAYEIPVDLNIKYKVDSIQVRVLGGPILSKVQNEYTINGTAPFRITIAASLMDVNKIEIGDVIEVMYGSKA